MNSDCEIKIRNLQKYVPFLRDLIETLKEDSTEGAKLNEMQSLHELLTKPDAGATFDMLLKCEEVLEKVFGNTQKEKANSPGYESPVREEITESLNEIFNKMDKADANEAILEKCFKKHSEETCDQSSDSKTEKKTNSNNSELEISEKSEDQNQEENLQEKDQNRDETLQEDDQNKDVNLQEKDQNKDENLQEDDQDKDVNLQEEDKSTDENPQYKDRNEDHNLQEKNKEEELPNENISVKQDDPPNKSHESQKEDDQPENEVSKEVDSEVIAADEIIQERQNHDHDLIDDKKEENKIYDTVESLEGGGNKKEETSQKLENEINFTNENIQEGQKEEQYTIEEKPEEDVESASGDLLEENKNKKDETSPIVVTTDEVLEKKEDKKEGTSAKVETKDEALEKKENNMERTPLSVETIDEVFEEKYNKEGTPSRVETLSVEQTTEEVDEKNENEKNDAKENNDEVQIVQTSPIDSENPKNCDENKVNTERDDNTEKQSKEEQHKKVDVPEKSIEVVVKKEDKNDLELDSVEEVEIVENVKNKKQNSLNEQNNKSKNVASPSESTSKRLLPKRPKPVESNSTVKAIELKPKDPSEKSAVVYLVKKGAPKPVETIDLLDSDSEDDDVILVSEVGLKKKTPTSKTAAKRMMPANKTPQIPAKVPSVIRQSTQGNKLMFAITSVQSIGQQEQQKRQQQQPTQLAHIQRNKNLIISPTKVRTQGIYTPGTITFHKVNQSQPAGVPPRTYIGVKQSTPLTANKFVNRLNSQIVISNVGSTAGTSNTKPTVGIVNRSNTQNNQILKMEDPAIDLINRSTKEEESPWNPDKDCQRSKDWLENFLSNVLSPTQNVTPFGVDLLQRSLDIPVFARIRTILEENKKVIVSTLDKDVKVMHKNADEIMALFFKDGSLTDAGVKLAGFAKQAMNRVFTTDRRTGNITSKGRKRTKELEDDEYSPSVIVEFAQETVANRRRSLRRESKANRKQYFAYEDDDDTEFLEMVEEQARIEANNRANKINKVHRKPVPKRSNGSSSSSETPSVKKMRLEEGTSVETPFETDLLKPTWVEDAVGEAYQDQFNEGADEPDDDQEEQDGGGEYSYQDEDKQKQTEPAPEGKINTWKMSRLGRYHSKWKNFKNINRAHHCRSTFIDSCILCNVKHNFVVAHYVNHHRETEVLIARLTQRDVDQLVRNVNYGYLTASKSTAHQYSATCVFCKREMTFALRYWWEHYSMHTGEYGYECTKCFLRRPRRQHAQKHANNECHLGTADVRIIYDFDKTMNQIDAYICKLCNYIQIHKENVVNHLTKQHDIQNDLQTNIIRVVLLQIARPYNEDVPGQDSQNNSNSFDYYENFNGGMSIGADNSYPDYDPNDEPDVTYMQYSGGMMGHDDLSFMICDMLATDDPTQQLPPSTSFSFDTSSTLKKDGGTQ